MAKEFAGLRARFMTAEAGEAELCGPESLLCIKVPGREQEVSDLESFAIQVATISASHPRRRLISLRVAPS